MYLGVAQALLLGFVGFQALFLVGEIGNGEGGNVPLEPGGLGSRISLWESAQSTGRFGKGSSGASVDPASLPL